MQEKSAFKCDSVLEKGIMIYQRGLDLSTQTKLLAGATSADGYEICDKNYMTKQYQAQCFFSLACEKQTLKVFI